jgi:concentrative nucleoside transporter, CNT family
MNWVIGIVSPYFPQAGIDILFGKLVEPAMGYNLALHAIPVIIFFSSLISVLYHLKIIQFLVNIIGGVLEKILGVDRVEGLFAAANIFVGQAESPLVVKPYLPAVTNAQLFALMTSGMAGVAGTVLAVYTQMGVRLEYLLAASCMSAPAGLALAKIIMPEQEAMVLAIARETRAAEINLERHPNVIMAAAVGAQTGLKIAASVGAMVLAFVALLTLADMLLGSMGGLVGHAGLTFEGMIGRVFAPIMFALGVPWAEAHIAGSLFGEKLAMNEFVAYLHYVRVAQTLSLRTQAIVTFALCGFANLSSIAIQIAVIGGLAPEKRSLISALGVRAVAAASLANLLSGVLAGMLVT